MLIEKDDELTGMLEEVSACVRNERTCPCTFNVLVIMLRNNNSPLLLSYYLVNNVL